MDIREIFHQKETDIEQILAKSHFIAGFICLRTLIKIKKEKLSVLKEAQVLFLHVPFAE